MSRFAFFSLFFNVVPQSTNLGVRSSNLFGRASNSLILIQNLCAVFTLLTGAMGGAAPGQHRSFVRMDVRV
jgi:hypothetical protein